MKKNLQTAFITRQHMLSRDFELYYYNDHNLSKVDLHSHNYYEFYFFMEGDVSIQIGTEVYPIHFGDIMLVPPHIPHRPIIHSTASPYRRFVFWISQEYCNHLLQISKDYAYLMQHVQVSQNYFFPTDRITFNAIQSKLLRLIEEVRSDRFGRDAQIPLYVNDLLLYLNRLVYERLHPQKSRTEESLLHTLRNILTKISPLKSLPENFLSANTTLPMYSRIIWDCRFTSTLQKNGLPFAGKPFSDK